MSETLPKRIRRQRLGLRLETEPYYTIVEQTETRLVLCSRAGANYPTGRMFMNQGALLAVLTPLIMLAFFIGGSQSAGDVLFGALLGWPFALLGLMRWTGGRAVATTENSITIDTAAQTLIYQQTNTANRLRSQTLYLDQIDHLRLRPRLFRPPGLFRRPRPVVALEFVTDEQFTWVVDSAADAEALRPTAQAMAAILRVPLETGH